MFSSFDIADCRYVDAVSSAIETSRISFRVQGIHDVHNRDLVLYRECLALLTDANGVKHEASMFVPALELLGATPLLDRCMIRLVLDQLEADPLAVLGCNISADTLAREDDWQSLIGQIKARKHLASRLVLELIESRPLGILSTLNDHLDEAKSLGCQIAIDDFGAGYLPPLQLYSLRPDIVKLDAGFLWQTRKHAGWYESLRHFVSFAASFAPIVVVEGVETELDFFRAGQAGATHAQGWLLSRPFPIAQADRP